MNFGIENVFGVKVTRFALKAKENISAKSENFWVTDHLKKNLGMSNIFVESLQLKEDLFVILQMFIGLNLLENSCVGYIGKKYIVIKQTL